MFYNIKKTRNVNLSYQFLFVMCVVLSSLAFATGVFAQTAQPSPSPTADDTELGGYKVKSTIEIGGRAKSVDGNDLKFRSDFNYKPGVRVFNSSFALDSKEGDKHLLFDSLLVNASGWGADPQGYTRVNMEKVGVYSFDANVRKIGYFSHLNNIANGQHRQYANNKMGDFDIKFLPQNDKIRVNLGYSYTRFNGPGYSTARPTSDEFMVEMENDAASDDVRAGVEGKLLGFDLGFTEGYRHFSDHSNLNWYSFNEGNLATTAVVNGVTVPTGVLTSYRKTLPVIGESFYSIFSAHRTFAKAFDFTAKAIYSDTRTKNGVYEVAYGTNTTPNYVNPDIYNVTGQGKRPQFRGELGMSWRATDKLTLSNTTLIDKFTINTGYGSLRTLLSIPVKTLIPATTYTYAISYRKNSFRRIGNTIEADYQFTNHIAAHIGYRYTQRKEDFGGYDKTATNNATTPVATFEDEKNNTNTFIGGMKIKPMKYWTIFWDAERGTADNIFTKLDNYKFTNLRFRNRLSFNKFGLTLSAISKENLNPAETNTGQPFGARVKNRIYSGAFDWNPIPEVTVATGYTYTHLTSFVDVVIPYQTLNGTTTITVTNQGSSVFYVRDHNFYLDFTATPNKRVSLYASYRIDKDKGQGDRVSPFINTFVNSYPFTLQSPEFRAAFRLTKNIDWNIGYQYYNYKEKFQTAQDYKAHLPYTSVTFYFGGATDR